MGPVSPKFESTLPFAAMTSVVTVLCPIHRGVNCYKEQHGALHNAPKTRQCLPALEQQIAFQ